MLFTIIASLVTTALPVGVISFFLFHSSFEAGHLDRSHDLRTLRTHSRAMRKKAKKDRKEGKKDGEAKGGNKLHSKWLKFGGGFYGVMGLWTYLVVELGEVLDFFRNFTGILDFFKSVSFDLLLSLFINSLMNFITAITWPVFWLGRLDGDEVWIALIAAYAGYLAGIHQARRGLPEMPKWS